MDTRKSRPGRERRAGGRGRLPNARGRRRLVVAVIAWVGCSTPPVSESPPDPIILISLDTLRWDHVGAMGQDRDHTPHIDALADDGVAFRTAIANAPWTLPSHASVFTGQYPTRHGVRFTGFALDPSQSPHMAERLGEAGYSTAAFVNKGFWRHSAGLDRGFDVTEDIPTGRYPAKIRDWITDRSGEPRFLFVHNFGVTAFDAPKIEPRRVGSFGYDLLAFLRHHHDHDITPEVESELLPVVRERYGLAVENIDEQVGTLVGWLRTAGLYDRSTIVVFSDHGTELGDHGRTYHGHSVYEELIRVPLVIKFPDNRHGGRVVDRAVQLMDVFPTVLRIAGLDIDPREIDGIDLAELAANPGRPHPPAVSEVYGSYTQFTVRSDSTKLTFIESPDEPGVIRYRSFDLVRDPGERSPGSDLPEDIDWQSTVERIMGLPIDELILDGYTPPAGQRPRDGGATP